MCTFNAVCSVLACFPLALVSLRRGCAIFPTGGLGVRTTDIRWMEGQVTVGSSVPNHSLPRHYMERRRRSNCCARSGVKNYVRCMFDSRLSLLYASSSASKAKQQRSILKTEHSGVNRACQAAGEPCAIIFKVSSLRFTSTDLGSRVWRAVFHHAWRGDFSKGGL